MRLILADDTMLFREGAARLLQDAGFDVVGQAGDATELLALVRREHPDVAVIDIRMPPTRTSEGLDAAATLRRSSPSVGLLLLSQHVETHSAVRLMTESEGGVGYLLKERGADLAGFAADVRRVAGGECVIDAELVSRLVAKKRQRDRLDRLTDRDRTVLDLMARGRSNRALARELHLSAETVEAHVRSIFTKLDLVPDDNDHRRVLAVLRPALFVTGPRAVSSASMTCQVRGTPRTVRAPVSAQPSRALSIRFSATWRTRHPRAPAPRPSRRSGLRSSGAGRSDRSTAASRSARPRAAAPARHCPA